MRVRVYSAKKYFPQFDANLFVNIPGEPTFDPKHPGTYPGDEVEIVEVLAPEDALAKYGKQALCSGQDVLYQQQGQSVIILQRTGKTSRDIIYETADW